MVKKRKGVEVEEVEYKISNTPVDKLANDEFIGLIRETWKDLRIIAFGFDLREDKEGPVFIYHPSKEEADENVAKILGTKESADLFANMVKKYLEK